jgi:hypothetical protein
MGLIVVEVGKWINQAHTLPKMERVRKEGSQQGYRSSREIIIRIGVRLEWVRRLGFGFGVMSFEGAALAGRSVPPLLDLLFLRPVAV